MPNYPETRKYNGQLIYPNEYRPGSILELALVYALEIYKKNQNNFGHREFSPLKASQENIERILRLLEKAE